MSISPCDAVPILKRTGKFQPGPEINATIVQSQNTLTSNELLLKLKYFLVGQTLLDFLALHSNDPASGKITKYEFVFFRPEQSPMSKPVAP